MNFLIDLFTNIIKNKVVEKLAGSRILNWYTKYKEFQKKVGKIKSTYTLMINPNNWVKAITSVPRNEINSFFKDLADWKKHYNKPEFNNNDKYLYDNAEMPSDPGVQQFKPNKEAERKLNEMQKELNGEGRWVNLSSSWIKRGMYKMTFKNKLLGVLSLELKTSNTIYAYPMVPYDVWVLMKEANGMNGTRENPRGAGSVFWKYWLDKWLPSALRRKVKNDFENKKIGKDEYNVALEQVQVSARSYYRSNTSKYTQDALNKDWYLSQGRGKGYKTYRYNTYNNLYTTKYTSQYYTEPYNGFTSNIKINKRRNPDYINKKKQADINRQAKNEAKKEAQPFVNILNARKKAKRYGNYASHPINNAKRGVKKAIRGKIKKKWGK